ncbi:glycosyltransferase family 39 protein [Candidatus Dojkabacteria bacterium]|uniref:Glycosyltransferase family 39 protein n=1 Tax=Candidatus Dojkabacteria bacterium TaxID=2099670 RepID=A0A955HYV6_9BACT|nr:glycosyltransferase family 39 protein [Candidatus Dojkabacteria bacterium]MCB9790567.1 glycosyltransferase family 39 protein [Candidatus Nomurabacteria bacterium]
MKSKKKILIKQLKTLVIPALIALIYFLLATNSILYKSSTTDEKYHLIRGVMALKTGDLRINQHHPYLFNVIPAIPTALNKDVKIPSLKLDEWKYADKDNLANIFFDLNGGRGDFEKKVLNPSRILMISINASFLIAYYLIIQKRFRTRVASISSLMLAFSPTYIAHSRLVTTDAPAAITIFLASIALYDVLKEKNINKKKIALFAVLAFVAILTKYTAFMIAPIWAFILFLFVSKRSNGGSMKKILHATKTVFVIIAAWGILLTAAYRFHFNTLEEMTYGNPYKIESREGNFDLIRRTYGDRAANIAIYLYKDFKWPFPQYVNGFMENVLLHNYTGHGTFLLGHFSQKGWWYYFPFAYFTKETLITVGLSVLSTFFYLGYKIRETFKIKKLRWPELALWAIFLPAATIIILAMKSSINLGVRHILPTYPLIFLLISILISAISLKSKYLDYAVGTLLAISIFMTLQIHPNYIEYFNEFVGGPQNGYLYLRDSNLDWYQDKILDLNFVRDNEVYGISQNIEDLKEGNARFFRVDKDTLYGNPSNASQEMLKLKKLVDTGKVAIVGTIENTGFVLYTEGVKL